MQLKEQGTGIVQLRLFSISRCLMASIKLCYKCCLPPLSLDLPLSPLISHSRVINYSFFGHLNGPLIPKKSGRKKKAKGGRARNSTQSHHIVGEHQYQWATIICIWWLTARNRIPKEEHDPLRSILHVFISGNISSYRHTSPSVFSRRGVRLRFHSYLPPFQQPFIGSDDKSGHAGQSKLRSGEREWDETPSDRLGSRKGRRNIQIKPVNQDLLSFGDR